LHDQTSHTLQRMVAAAIVLACCALIAGCTLGPAFHAPEPPAVQTYPASALATETASADIAAGQAQRFVTGRDIPAEWWTLFQNPALDALIRQALSDSPKLAEAHAKLTRAQEELEGRRGATRYPQVDASMQANRVDVQSDAFKSPALGENFPITLTAASVSVSYTLDLFGRNRRELEALQAAVDYERFQLEAARLMLAGNVAVAAIEDASLRDEIAALEAALALQTRQVEIVERLEEIGAASKLDVVTRSGELARARAALPPLRERLEKNRNRLAVYLGQPPAGVTLPELVLGDLHLPTELPLSLPSALARQRPDIRAAEALLHEASARVGVATANRYPQISLSANAGALAVSPLTSGAAAFAMLGASVAQPLFHGGELRARERSAVAAYDQAGAAWRQVVLAALQSVADTLVALDADAKTLREQATAADQAKAVLGIMSKQYDAGAVSLLTLLEAQRQVAAASVEETRAVANRFTDSAALFQALGGGWWSRDANDHNPPQP
jgi:NodT family efflux transporter outer membrane factor (OMF) lipoprotein